MSIQYKKNSYHFFVGICDLCGRTIRLITDHCGKHGWVRGAICESCNQSLKYWDAQGAYSKIIGQCFHVHRSDKAALKCRRAWHKEHGRRAEYLANCRDCLDIASSTISPPYSSR